MQTVSPVEIKAGKVCGAISRQEVDAAKFRMGGHLLDAKEAAPLREQMHLFFKDFFDHESCTSYLDQGGIRLAKSTMDGVPTPATTDIRVLWVSPKEGYIVSP